MNERSGVCFICGGLAEPAYSCRMCGAVVCRKCYDAEKGLCVKCSSKTRA